MDLQVEFTSMLAQAQRAIGINGVDRFVGSMGAVSQFKPEVLDKFNPDAWADSYADMLNIDPKLILPDEAVQQIRQARAQVQQQQAQQAQMQQQASAMKYMASADTSGKNGLTDIMNMFSGYNSPSPVEVGNG